jgi:hypothetical protein
VCSLLQAWVCSHNGLETPSSRESRARFLCAQL